MHSEATLPLVEVQPSDSLRNQTRPTVATREKGVSQMATKFSNKSHYDGLCELFLGVLQDKGLKAPILSEIEALLEVTKKEEPTTNSSEFERQKSQKGQLVVRKVNSQPLPNYILAGFSPTLLQVPVVYRSNNLSSLINTFEYAMTQRESLCERREFLLRVLKSKCSATRPTPSQAKNTPEPLANRFQRLFTARKMPSQLNSNKLGELGPSPNLDDLINQARNRKSGSDIDIFLHFKHMKTCFGHGKEEETQRQKQGDHIFNVVFDKGGKLVISGDQQGLLKIWSAKTGLLLHSFKGHTSYIEQLHVSSSGKYLVSCGNDSIRVWSLRYFNCLCVFEIDKPILCTNSFVDPETNNEKLCFADSEHLYVVDENEFLTCGGKRLELGSIKRKQRIRNAGKASNVESLGISPQGYLLLGLESGEIILLHKDVFTGEASTRQNVALASMLRINEHVSKILELEWNKSGSYFLSASADDCRLWHFTDKAISEGGLKSVDWLRSPKCHKRGRKRGVYCHDPRWSKDDKYFVVAFSEVREAEGMPFGEGQILVYEMSSRKVIHEVRNKLQHDIREISFLQTHPVHPNIALFAELTGKIVILDILKCQILNMFEERAYHMNHPAAPMEPLDGCFSPDGNSFAVSTQLGSVSIYGYGLRDFYMGCPSQQFHLVDHEDFHLDSNLVPHSVYDEDRDINGLQQGPICNIRDEPYQFRYNNDLLQLGAGQYFQRSRTTTEITPSYKPEANFLNIFNQQQEELSKLEELFSTNYQVMQAITDSELQSQQKRTNDELKVYLKAKLDQFNQINTPFGLTTMLKGMSVHTVPEAAKLSNGNIKSGEDSGKKKPQAQPVVQRTTRGVAPMRRLRRIDSSDGEAQLSSQESFRQEEEEERSSESEPEWNQDSDQDSELVTRRAKRNKRQTQRNGDQGYSGQAWAANVTKRRPEVEIQELEEEFNQHLRNISRRRRIVSEDSEEAVKKPNLNQLLATGPCTRCQVPECDSRCKCGKSYCGGCASRRGRGPVFKCFECIFRSNNISEERSNTKKEFWNEDTRRLDKYAPQIGDLAYFFFQGYEEFTTKNIDILNNKGLFTKGSAENDRVTAFRLMEFMDRPLFKSNPLCTVKNLEFRFPLKQKTGSERVEGGRFEKGKDLQALLTLQTVETSETFRVFYQSDCEFLVPKEIYQSEVQTYERVTVNDIVKSKEGSDLQILIKEPYQKTYPESLWKTLTVSQANVIRCRNRKMDTRINFWKLQSTATEFAFSCAVEPARAQMIEGNITRLKADRGQLFEYFEHDVDTKLYRDYSDCVPLPISVDKIERRLRSQFYSSIEMLKFDINLISHNSLLYNGEESNVTFTAVTLSSELLNIVEADKPLKWDRPLEAVAVGSPDKSAIVKPEQNVRRRRGRPPAGTTGSGNKDKSQDSEEKIRSRRVNRVKYDFSSEEGSPEERKNRMTSRSTGGSRLVNNNGSDAPTLKMESKRLTRRTASHLEE